MVAGQGRRLFGGNIGDQSVDLLYLMVLAPSLAIEQVLQHILSKPDWYPASVWHNSSTLELNFSLGVVQMNREGGRAGVNVWA